MEIKEETRLFEISNELDILRERLYLDLKEQIIGESKDLFKHIESNYNNKKSWNALKEELIDSLLDNLGS